jgi:hypothetical protein
MSSRRFRRLRGSLQALGEPRTHIPFRTRGIQNVPVCGTLPYCRPRGAAPKGAPPGGDGFGTFRARNAGGTLTFERGGTGSAGAKRGMSLPFRMLGQQTRESCRSHEREKACNRRANRRMPPSRERGPSSPLPPLSSLPLGSLLCSACPDSRSLLSGTQWLVRLVDHPPRPIAHPKRARPRLELSADVTARSCPALPTHRALMPHHQKTAVPRRTAVVTRSKASDQERQDHAAQRCRLDE